MRLVGLAASVFLVITGTVTVGLVAQDETPLVEVYKSPT